MRDKFQTGGVIPGKVDLVVEPGEAFIPLNAFKFDVNLKDPALEVLDVIYEHIKKIQEEQERELLTEYLKDKYILVGTPLVKAMVENDERFKDCKVFYCKYADPDKIFIIRRFDLGLLDEGI